MIKFQGKTIQKIQASHVIIGSASLNSTPSRALDILIASNEFKRIGFLVTAHIEPAVGYLNKKVESGRLGLPAQVYQKDDVVIIQLRSTIRMGRKQQFVEELSKLLADAIKPSSIYVVGSLPYSVRPDLEIQSVSKNAYYYTNLDKEEQLAKAELNNIIKPIKLLFDHDEEVSDIVGQAGFVKSAIKSSDFPKFTYICVFSQNIMDHQAAFKLAKAVSVVSGKKQLGIADQSILNE